MASRDTHENQNANGRTRDMNRSPRGRSVCANCMSAAVIHNSLRLFRRSLSDRNELVSLPWDQDARNTTSSCIVRSCGILGSFRVEFRRICWSSVTGSWRVSIPGQTYAQLIFREACPVLSVRNRMSHSERDWLNCAPRS